MSDILVILESREGALRPVSLETLGAARQVADARGSQVVALATEQGDYDAAAIGAAGADRLLVADAHGHSADGAAATAARVAQDAGCSLVLAAATVRGRDLGARVAAKLGCGLTADCTAIDLADAAHPVFTRPVYAGKAELKVRHAGGRGVATLRGNFFAPAGRSAEAAVENIGAEGGSAQVVALSAQASGRPDVAEANRVVSGGRGIGSAEQWGVVEALADALGAGLGASRAVVDAGWRPHSEQVGQTGKTVAPELYFACGISGAIQHLAGMSGSKVIVAINKDADAPIFQHASYGIVGDVHEVLPALTDALAAVVN
ncbi:MAG: electron transfer flavoprotein subunit alpha/FixB family protein [Planctomycetota bacterium]|jgi:electron transfer flavoprotein alpha subunit